MYYFYMGSVLLPITPDKFTVKVKNANKTITLINEGEVNFLKEAGLTELEFDAVRLPLGIFDGNPRRGYHELALRRLSALPR